MTPCEISDLWVLFQLWTAHPSHHFKLKLGVLTWKREGLELLGLRGLFVAFEKRDESWGWGTRAVVRLLFSLANIFQISNNLI